MIVGFISIFLKEISRGHSSNYLHESGIETGLNFGSLFHKVYYSVEKQYS